MTTPQLSLPIAEAFAAVDRDTADKLDVLSARFQSRAVPGAAVDEVTKPPRRKRYFVAIGDCPSDACLLKVFRTLRHHQVTVLELDVGTELEADSAWVEIMAPALPLAEIRMMMEKLVPLCRVLDVREVLPNQRASLYARQIPSASLR